MKKTAEHNFKSTKFAAEEPYHIPGYAGHKAQYRFQCGNTFGATTHKLLVATRNSKPIRPKSAPSISKRTNVSFRDEEQLYRPHMRSGYMGHVPGTRLSRWEGRTYPEVCRASLEVFGSEQERYRKKLEQTRRMARQHPGLEPLDHVPKSAARVPLRALKFSNHKETKLVGLTNGPHKHFMSGYGGHVPCYDRHFSTSGGKSFPLGTGSALKLFADRQARIRNDVAPPSVMRSAAKRDIHDGNGLIPKYSGYVPGEKFRYGQRFTSSTKNVRATMSP